MPSGLTLPGGRGGEDGRPHYLALRDQIASAIAMGKLAAGARLPSERQLQTDTGTARGTIRDSLPLGAAGKIDAALPGALTATFWQRTGPLPVVALSLLVLFGSILLPRLGQKARKGR